ncbi:hypothetical protein RB195_013906 [Necator americanus]|uniref:Uncharacterized protein n=1 Tax=Necator americanus TaxID=51031 RepID=A0ABR1DXQ2_NECAM
MKQLQSQQPQHYCAANRWSHRAISSATAYAVAQQLTSFQPYRAIHVKRIIMSTFLESDKWIGNVYVVSTFDPFEELNLEFSVQLVDWSW